MPKMPECSHLNDLWDFVQKKATVATSFKMGQESLVFHELFSLEMQILDDRASELGHSILVLFLCGFLYIIFHLTACDFLAVTNGDRF